jgi:hypothetical protein
MFTEPRDRSPKIFRKEAIESAGLDYTVAKKTLQAVINGRVRSDVPGNLATIRTDTHQVLGVVGSRNVPIQNRDAFAFYHGHKALPTCKVAGFP